MRNLSGDIEAYIKALLRETEEGMLEIQRRLLSEHFSCVPSQINYVLNTRFTPEKGYLVESKRGGGGYVRIVSIPLESKADYQALERLLEDPLSEVEGKHVLAYLVKERVMDPSVAKLFEAMLSDEALKPAQELSTEGLRSHLLQQMLLPLVLQAHAREES